ncbi:autoinducer binding domain-containing protein [Pseudooceanicola sp. CBS1P-1]|uniref:HTH luxR-type domain-containing protein n=1 Tax=Pseudooceanicola albus TaxID=2692189 RepID=A0A6L7GAV4_9RHOB|nr:MULTISPECIES: autoinducer binding domain-containing protein [Pseudooceanicola]MBT9386601.1 autoinducer binding domain-containing protein [Pseudooceanicola endophyticus]MXN20717.1 hypothetical protein [Pseudooceanicola albus]
MPILASASAMRRRFKDFSEWNATAMRLAPAGYYLSIHRRTFCSAEAAYSSLSAEWLRYYTDHMFALRDPLLHWGLINEGTSRWTNVDLSSILQEAYTDRVVEKARDCGMTFGAVSFLRSDVASPIKSCLIVARNDRELTGTELEETDALLHRIVASVPLQSGLSKGEIELLRLLARGMTQAEASQALGLSSPATKKRLERARASLGARTTTNAVALAMERGILQI